MDSIDWMFICIGIVAIGIVGARYFEYKTFQEQNKRCKIDKGNLHLPLF
jgi:hypothetical protein